MFTATASKRHQYPAQVAGVLGAACRHARLPASSPATSFWRFLNFDSSPMCATATLQSVASSGSQGASPASVRSAYSGGTTGRNTEASRCTRCTSPPTARQQRGADVSRFIPEKRHAERSLTALRDINRLNKVPPGCGCLEAGQVYATRCNADLKRACRGAGYQ
jgi:hypothetical protein